MHSFLCFSKIGSLHDIDLYLGLLSLENCDFDSKQLSLPVAISTCRAAPMGANSLGHTFKPLTLYDISIYTIYFSHPKRTPAAELAASLDHGCFHPVTVKSRTYMVYRYEGPLNKIDHAVVLLSYPADAIGRKSALRVFLCSDPSLSDEAILEYYSHRWSIEVMFRSHKRYMGLKSFMVRSAKAIDRLLLILALAHFFFSCGLGRILPFHSGLRLCRSAFVKF